MHHYFFRSSFCILLVILVTACVPDLRLAGDAARDGNTDATGDMVVRPDGGMCPTGLTLCGGTCVDTRTSAAHCGGCGVTCTGGPNGEPSCSAGACALTCTSGFGDCDGNVATGCETNLATDPTHCGSCTMECAGATNAAAVCAGSVCGITCRAGYGDCDGNSANGCEASLDVAATCGTCGNHCTGTTPYCVLGGGAAMCVASCFPGTSLCGSSCVDTVTDANHCGSCTTVCPAPSTHGIATCTTSTCGIACDTGYHACNGQCVSDNSTASCGASCTPCATPSNAMATCSGGMCGIVCSAGFADCDGDASNGCETNLQNDASHCGACATSCSYAHASGTCTSGSCSLGACAAGFADCNGNAGDGCETNLMSSTGNCGACGNACTGTAAICNAGTCGTTACSAGTGNCDGNLGNGCETSLSSDPNNCGACGNACSFGNASPSCSGGTCALGACVNGFGNCDGNASNGCETPLVNDVSNCGACGNGCGYAHGNAACSGGNCSLASCQAGWGNCNSSAGDGCETDFSNDTAHCGNCTTSCAVAHGSPGCSGGSCTVASCSAGFANCNGNVGDGCEAQLASDPANCGSCGHACSTFGTDSVACNSGVCVPTCTYGYGNCDGNPENGCEADFGDPTHCGSCTTVCPQLRQQCCFYESGSGYCARPIDICP